jgi:D-alanyl-D-alanine carboxypeptidase/D-alanyl-D-alanine-endopeptidase (penicillin-binding protein 4)
MRAFFAALGAAVVLAAGLPAGALAQSTPPAQQSLQNALNKGIAQAGGRDGAYVVDLTTGQALFAASPDVARLPASVQKLYTTSTALLRFGPTARLTTSIFGQGTRGPKGTWMGTLYLRGGGDPTFGSAAFDQAWYGTGATVQTLVSSLRQQAGITGVLGRVVGDPWYFDLRPGTPATGYRFSPWVEGSLSAVAFNRGLLNHGNSGVSRPALFAAQQLVSALRAGGVRVPRGTRVAGGSTPRAAQRLATVSSPSMATLIALANTPSDNFIAETLLKDIGARFGGAGTTAAGAAIVRSDLASQFGITPTFDDGSGLSYDDYTTPRQVVTLLSKQATNSYFVNSLAVGGETGTLQHEMRGTIAQGRCRGKTGTLSSVANLAGYCQAADGHTLAFAFLMSSVRNTDTAHAIEANMAVALAKYNG